MLGRDMSAPSLSVKQLWPRILQTVIIVGIIGGVIIWTGGRQRAVTQDLGDFRDIIVPDGGLRFKTKTGKVIAKIDADKGGGFLTLYNASDEAVVLLGGSEYGGGLIGVTRGKGAGAVLQLSGHEDGGSIAFFNAKHGKRAMVLSSGEDGGSLSIKGPTGDPAVEIDTHTVGSIVNGRIEVRESISGKLLWTAPVANRDKQ